MTGETRRSPPPTRRRTLGRELALKVLYQIDLLRLGSDCPFEDLSAFQETDPEAIAFGRSLADGVRSHLSGIDAAIRAAARNWDIGRMAVVDRNILRIATFELLHAPETPARVVINEAVELARKFSTAASSAFVNGVLDEIRRTHRTTADAAPPPAAPGTSRD